MSGPRLLLVHLFLPETLEFHDWPDEGAQLSPTQFVVPSQDAGAHHQGQGAAVNEAPSSPCTGSKDLAIDELNARLSHASVKPSQDQAYPEEDAFSDTDGPALAPISETGSAVPASAPRAPKSRGSRSARGSFNEQSKKVNMSSLMAEAASGSALSALDPSLASPQRHNSARRGSSSDGMMRPTVLEPKSTNEPLPVAAASDHGRGASANSAQVGKMTSISGSTQSNVAPRSRRGSDSRAGNASLSALSPSLTHRDRATDLQGTRTPGAQAGGKAGTLTPLSIIGDLAAKQSNIAPRQMPTAGDTDRHHPFGSGAVTPMREPKSLATSGSRTPGTRPAPQSQSRPSAKSLGLSRMTELAPSDLSRQKSLQTLKSSSKVPSPAAAISHGDARQSRSPSSDNWAVNDHGRGADSASTFLQKPGRPQTLSRQTTTSNLSPLQRAADDSSRRSPLQAPGLPSDHPLRHKGASQQNTQGPSIVSSMTSQPLGRATSKSRVPLRSMRRQSSLGGRNVQRMSAHDIGDDTIAISEGTNSPSLPPFDFVSNPSANGGLNNAVKSLPKERLRGVRYVGTPGVSSEGWAGKAEKKFISTRMKAERDMVPVWVEDDVFDAAYPIFCKQILWPTFHYTLPTARGHDHEHHAFEKYRQLNVSFAEKIVEEYREGDIVFINDYHLLLVPLMVREKLPHSKICFFLHIAWPSSEIFRCLSARTHILRGMLGADLVGFQTANFARHFRQTVSRILQLEATPKGIQIDGRGGFVAVGTFPIGIDVAQLNQRRVQPDVQEWVSKLRERYEGKKVIVGRDKLDFIKGVRQKLLAFETALDEHKELVGQVVLLQVALATTEENEEVAAATEVVSRINSKYSSLTYQPVVFLHVQDITFCQYLALLTIADAFLATSVREGMNLTSHEFVVCQKQKHKPLILSEFTGTYSSLRACIGINPWNTKQVADAIYKAITMSEDEAFERWKDLHRQVTTQDAQHWIQSLLGRLERAHIDQQRRNNTFMPLLEISQSEWRASKTRLILIDLEETLVHENPLVSHERGFEPPDRVIKILADLTADAKNRVYILSGKGAHDLDKIVKHVPRLGAVAENGCAIMYAGNPPPATKDARDREVREDPPQKSWQSLVAGTNMSWRSSVKEILSYFTERTPGSWLEDRGASILWRFWNGNLDEETVRSHDFQWAKRQAAEVQNLIYDSLGERFSLRIIPGSRSFLIMPKNTSRASAIQHVVSLSSVGAQALVGSDGAVLHMPTVEPLGSVHGSANDGATPALPRELAARPFARSDLDRSKGGASDSQALFRQPSNVWFAPSDQQNFSSSTRQRIEENAHLLHPYGLGSFDFVLCVGQDDMLLGYINSLDLSFASITCTSCGNKGSLDGRGVAGGGIGIGSEAHYYVDGPDQVIESLQEILDFRGRDQRWGVPAMVDV